VNSYGYHLRGVYAGIACNCTSSVLEVTDVICYY